MADSQRPGGEASSDGPVAVAHIRVGDIVVLGDGTLAVIDSVCFGSYWLDSGPPGTHGSARLARRHVTRHHLPPRTEKLRRTAAIR